MEYTNTDSTPNSDIHRAMSAKLQLQTFKAETLLEMFGKCAGSCNLQFRESGIKEGDAEDVNCFKNCIAKGAKISEQLFS